MNAAYFSDPHSMALRQMRSPQLHLKQTNFCSSPQFSQRMNTPHEWQT